MSRTVIAAAAVGLCVLLAGCQDSGEPAQPPTGEPALTTASSTTSTDEAVVTTDVATATEEPTSEEPTADGPPEMPEEATEQTEDGAEAFVEYYVALINYTGKHPTEGLLEPLGGDACKSCRNHEESVAYGVQTGDYLEEDTFQAGDAQAVLTAETARVEIPVEQPAQTYLNEGQSVENRALSAETATLVFRLEWADGWTVSEITVA